MRVTVYYIQCINVCYIYHPQLQHTNAKRTGGSEVAIQVFYSEQEAVQACELAGQHCQAISKFREKTAFVYTLSTNLNLFTEANTTLYVKAEFRENVSKCLHIYRYVEIKGKSQFLSSLHLNKCISLQSIKNVGSRVICLNESCDTMCYS